MNLDDGDDVYNWPWLYAVQVGEWGITDAQAKKLRDYLLRGGFFMADDFHGTVEWQVFEESMKRVFPDRAIVDIPDSDPIFHTVYDLDDRYQIVGEGHLAEGHKLDGYVARWRGIYDDKGRVMVAISFNSDIGDSWEWADEPHVSGEVFRARSSRRRELHRVCDDALSRAPQRTTLFSLTAAVCREGYLRAWRPADRSLHPSWDDRGLALAACMAAASSGNSG